MKIFSQPKSIVRRMPDKNTDHKSWDCYKRSRRRIGALTQGSEWRDS